MVPLTTKVAIMVNKIHSSNLITVTIIRVIAVRTNSNQWSHLNLVKIHKKITVKTI